MSICKYEPFPKFCSHGRELLAFEDSEEGKKNSSGGAAPFFLVHYRFEISFPWLRLPKRLF